MTWTDEKIADLTRMIGMGLSSSKIGKEIGTTRNSVIGKVHRMGLSRTDAAEAANRKAAAIGRQVPWSPTRVRKERAEELATKAARARPQLRGTKCRPPPPIEPTAAAAPPQPRQMGHVGLLDLMPGDCRFPMWNRRSEPQVFCAQPALEGTSWCAACAARVFSPHETRVRLMGRTVAQGWAA